MGEADILSGWLESRVESGQWTPEQAFERSGGEYIHEDFNPDIVLNKAIEDPISISSQVHQLIGTPDPRTLTPGGGDLENDFQPWVKIEPVGDPAGYIQPHTNLPTVPSGQYDPSGQTAQKLFSFEGINPFDDVPWKPFGDEGLFGGIKDIAQTGISTLMLIMMMSGGRRSSGFSSILPLLLLSGTSLFNTKPREESGDISDLPSTWV